MDKDIEDQSPIDSDTGANAKETTKKRSHKKIYIGLLVLLIVLIVPVLVAGWFGFVPGVSSLMGASKAKDLGVRYTNEDFNSYLQKTGVNFKDLNNAPVNPNKPGKFIVFSDPKNFNNIRVSQEELTAAINNSGWLWMPLTNTQVRLTDSNVEISGNLNIDYIANFINFIGGVGYGQNEVEKAVNIGKKFVGNAPVYIKANAEVQNNQATLNVTEATIGRYNVPLDITNKVLTNGTNNAIKNTSGLNAISAKPTNGSLEFSGSYPTVVYIKKN